MDTVYLHEYDEVIRRLTDRLGGEENWWDRLNETARSLADLAGRILDAFDEENRPAELAQFKVDALISTRRILDERGTRLPFLVRTLLPSAISAVIDAIAEHVEDLDDRIKADAVPILMDVRDTAAHCILRLAREDQL